MNKRRIAFVVAVTQSASEFLTNHFEILQKYFDITLIANFGGDENKKEFEAIGIRCIDAPIVRKPSLMTDLKALFVLKSIYKQEKVASIHSVTPKAGLLSAVAGWMAGVKVRIHIFTGQVWATRRGVMRTVLKIMDKMIALLDTNILVDGDNQRKFLIKEGVLKEKNSRVLANGSICGVNLEKFNISDEIRKTERAKFGFTSNDVVYIFLGRLNHDKGIGELFVAFNELLLECPNAKLVLYGKDEEGYDDRIDNYPNIKRNINYFYPGYTSSSYDALQCGDIFVLPTWREGFGSSVIEAQAVGLPVITSDTYGVMDASVPGETGLHCHVNDPEGLYKCMKQYYYDAALRKAHGDAGRKRVCEKFDCKIVTKAWLDYYIELLG